jgi:hypothetical protein
MRRPMRIDEHAQNNGHMGFKTNVGGHNEIYMFFFCRLVFAVLWFGSQPSERCVEATYSSLWHLISVSRFCPVYFNMRCWKQSRENQRLKSWYLLGLTWHATMLLLFHPLPEQGSFVPRAKFQGFASKTRDLNLKIHSCIFTFIIRPDLEQCPISCILSLVKLTRKLIG